MLKQLQVHITETATLLVIVEIVGCAAGRTSSGESSAAVTDNSSDRTPCAVVNAIKAIFRY